MKSKTLDIVIIIAVAVLIVLFISFLTADAQVVEPIFERQVEISESPGDSMNIVVELWNFLPDSNRIDLIQRFDYVKLGKYTWGTVIYYSDSQGFVVPTVSVTETAIDWKAEAAIQGVTWSDLLYIILLYFGG